MSTKRWRIALASAFTLALGLLSPLPAATATTVQWAPAGWSNYYAGSSSAKSVTKTPPPYVSHPKSATTQSTFIINYSNVPEIEKPAIQAAIDSWSANWKSAVPITVNATYARQASTAILVRQRQ